MWVRLSLLLALCLLPGGRAEAEEQGPRCRPPPGWSIGQVEPMRGAMGQVTVVALLQSSWSFCLVQASRLDGLHQRLERQGLVNVTFMVVNHHGEQEGSHDLLARVLSENITLYRQEPQQPDVWQALSGEKDDFFIYDRCGRLTSHISLPYSIIGQGNIETAIRDAYCKPICGDCNDQNYEALEECNRPEEFKPETDTAHGHGHHHGHHHHGHRGHGHGHGHGRDLDSRPAHGHGGQQEFDMGQLDLSDPQGQAPAEKKPWAVRWKLRNLWQGSGPGSEAWCWHWRRLFGDAGSEQPAGLWQCNEVLPASWQWHGPAGEQHNAVRETWQWRSLPADWQRPSNWAWAPGATSWDWQGL